MRWGILQLEGNDEFAPNNAFFVITLGNCQELIHILLIQQQSYLILRL